ncbi:GTP cyclohydrolase I FolE [Haliscomenobacter sp.]|uniref:GTP cyclohydrolase I FolE n=1 Tax=Haliscomenobacter sp. TaxID=2717303 RepID=UPI003364C42D
MVTTENSLDLILSQKAQIMGDNHSSSGIETPLRPDAFEMHDKEKMEIIAHHFAAIMDTLGMDLTDDSLQDTPKRVAKMFVQEIFQGLNPANKPEISAFENSFDYNRMLVEKNITVKTFCEHHFLPITGKAHVGYVSSGKVIGLSKLNRIVDYYARRPQVQERMTKQILLALQEALDTTDVIIVVDAKHMCVSHRGIQHDESTTLTLEYSGCFENAEMRREFLDYLK